MVLFDLFFPFLPNSFTNFHSLPSFFDTQFVIASISDWGFLSFFSCGTWVIICLKFERFFIWLLGLLWLNSFPSILIYRDCKLVCFWSGMSSQNQVTPRDLLEEAKKRVLFLVICIVGLSYMMSCKKWIFFCLILLWSDWSYSILGYLF